MTGGYIAVRHLSGDGCAHHCHKNFGGCSPMTCGIPSGHHWKRVAPPPEPRRNTDPKPTTYAEWEDLEEERDQLRAHRDRLAAELARVQGEVRRAWGRAAALWDGYDALKDFLDDESEDARDRLYSHLADHFQERVIEARQTLSRCPRPREDQINFAALAQPQDGTTEGRG